MLNQYLNSYMLLNIPNSAVNTKPMASMDFIFTNDISRLLILSLSSSLSIFFFCCLSKESLNISFFFSTGKKKKKLIIDGKFYNSKADGPLTFPAAFFHFNFEFLVFFGTVYEQPYET